VAAAVVETEQVLYHLKWMLVRLLCCLGAALVLAAPAAGGVDDRLSEVAGVRIVCEPMAGDEVGFFDGAAGQIHLRSRTCEALRKAPVLYSVRTSIAIHTLGHELGHAAGITDEAAADCYGAGQFGRLAKALGVGERRIDYLRSLAYWRAGYAPINDECWDRRVVSVKYWQQ
jgi:hypothetical protein